MIDPVFVSPKIAARRKLPAPRPSISANGALMLSSFSYCRERALAITRTGCPVVRPVITVERSRAFKSASLYAGWAIHSSLATKRVPICTPTAPNANIATKARPSAIPPAAITGSSTASTTCGTSAKVVTLPTWPPLSSPSAIMASTPTLANRLANATAETTGITLAPDALKRSMYFPGFPAPVVITGTFSSQTAATHSSTKGERSIKLTPKGFVVCAFTCRICSRRRSPGILPAPITPRPPASETAEANSQVPSQAIPP